MESQQRARTQSENASQPSAARRLAPRIALAAAFALLALVALSALSTPASAGWAQTNCPQRFVEVDDDYIVSSLVNCQFKTVLEVELLPLTSGDSVKIYNGTYAANWTMNSNGITVYGESARGVMLYSYTPLTVPILVNAQDINLSTMTLVGSDNGLQISIGAARATLTGLELQGNTTWGCDCHGSNLAVKNVTIRASQNGFYARGAGLNIDGLKVTTVGPFSSYKLVMSGANARAVNLTLVGEYTAPAAIYVFSPGFNITVANAFIENASYGIWCELADTKSTFRDIRMNNTTTAFYMDTTGAPTIDGLNLTDSATGIMNGGGAPQVGVFHFFTSNVTRPVYWSGAGGLNITDSFIRDVPGSAIYYQATAVLQMFNVSFDNGTSYALEAYSSATWIGGNDNNTYSGAYTDWGASGTLMVSGVNFTNISGAGITQGPSATGATFTYNTFENVGQAIYFSNYQYSPLVANNTVNGSFNSGIQVNGEYMRVFGNRINNSNQPFILYLSDTDLPQNWNQVTPDNLIDGKPIYYVINQTGFQVPSNASLVFIVNSTNILASGINQTSNNYIGVQVTLSSNVTIVDSIISGYEGIQAYTTVGLNVRNVTHYSQAAWEGMYLYNDKNVFIDGFILLNQNPNGYGIYFNTVTNGTLRNAIFVNSGGGLYSYGSDKITWFNVTAVGQSWQGFLFDTTTNIAIDTMLLVNGTSLFQYSSLISVANLLSVNATGIGLQMIQSSPGTLTNVTIINPQNIGLYVDTSNNWTVRNSTFGVENFNGAYLTNSPDFRTYNSTYVGINASAMFIDVGNYAIVAIHNNFYGGAISNTNNYGVWDAGYPAGGNYYAYAAGSFLDRYTGPGQNSVAGMDGIKDAPPYPVSPGKNDNYALMDPWPPAVTLTSPANGALIRAGTPINFSISNFFDSVTFSDNVTGGGTLAYPHDINTTGWADGWHTITIVATDSTILNRSLTVPNVTRSFSFEFDSTGPVFGATPALGTPALQQQGFLDITVDDPHLFAWGYSLDGSPSNATPPWSFDLSGFSTGAHTLILFANDSVNNSRLYIWNFYVDGQAPTVTLGVPYPDDYFQPGTVIQYDIVDDFNLVDTAFEAFEDGGSNTYAGALIFDGATWNLDTSSFADGCYYLAAYGEDEAGYITEDDWYICIDNENPDLSAYQGTFYADEDIDYTFDGSLYSDLDGAPAFEWTFDDTVLLSLTTLTGQYPIWVFDTPGNYNIHLKVTDNADNFAEADFTLNVLDTTDPVADFVAPDPVDEDVEFELNADLSTDNDGYWNGGASGTFSWNIESEGGFSDSIDGRQVMYTLLEPGFYNVTLSVWDATGNYNAITREIRVRDTTPPTIVVTGNRGPLNEGDTLSLNASTSTDNDVGSPLVFNWRFTYLSVVQSISTPAMAFQFLVPGTYDIAVHVSDRTGVENITHIFVRINDVPRVTNAPTTTVAAGLSYEWDATVEDNDTLDTRTFTLLEGPTGMSVSGAGVVAWNPSAGDYGVYNIAFRVSDGLSYTDFAYVLTVTRPANPNNHAPFFSTFPPSITVAGTYSYTVGIGDPDSGDHLTLALAAGPDGMTIDSNHVVHWIIPTTTSEVTYQIQLALSDGLITVYQNYTIRPRTNGAVPAFTAGKVPASASVDEGKTFTLTLDATFASDNDDAFDLLSFYATAADGTVLNVALDHSGNVWTLRLTGLKAGTTRVTLRVADPSGQSAEAPIDVTVAAVQTSTPGGGFPMFLLLGLALGAAGIAAIVVMRRRKKDDEEAPVVAPPAPPAPKAPAVVSVPAAAEVVQVEVMQAPAAKAPAATAAPMAAVGAAAAAAAGAAAAAAAAPSPKPKAATYVVEGLFVIYQDGRMIYSKTDIGRDSLGDPELVSSMFTAVQQFIKDSFSAEGELNKMGYGENQILIERGKTVFMATINFGEPDKELQETMAAAIEKMEYAYAGIIEAWDGNAGAFTNLQQFVAPVLALTAGVTRQDVLAATTTRDVKVLSQLEFFQGFVRLKVGIKNDTEAVITKVTLDIDFNEDVLRLQRIEPASYKTSGARVMLNVLNPGEKSSVAFYFDPQICTETNIDGIVRFRDYKGVLSSVTMKTRKAEVVCPLFFTKEHANTAMLKRLIENELQEKDSKIYTITKLPPYIKYKDIFDVAKSVVLSHDVHMVREFVSYNPFSGEAWFYGETKVKGYKIVIRAAVREDNTIEFFAASSTIKAVTGLLAEFNHTLVSMIVERYSDVKIEQVYDEAKKHEIQSKALIGKLGEGEAGAGETEQSR